MLRGMRFAILALLLSFTLQGEDRDTTLPKARRYIATWLSELPDFVCRQSTRRFAAGPSHDWRLEDSFITELTVTEGIEHYLLISKVGETVREPYAIDFDTLGSRGEFVSAVRVLFDAASKSVFHRRGARDQNGRHLRRFDFAVQRENSQWFLGSAPGYAPAYSGTVWVDESDGSLHQLDMETQAFPDKFAIRAASMRLEFAFVESDGLRYLMPSRADVRVCSNGAYCERKRIDFSDFRRFTAKSRLLQ